MKTEEYKEDERVEEREEEREEEQTDNMPTSLEEFLFEHPVEDQTDEVVLCERLKGYKFQIGTMTKEERTRYSNACMIRSKSGKVLSMDSGKFCEMVVLNHCLYPAFKNAEFVSRCKKNTPAQALYSVLKVGEVEALSQKIMEFNGFDQDFEDLRKQAKN